MICKILGLLVNPLTADDKYSLLNKGKLLQHFMMHLSQKRKIFSQFFSTFYKFRNNFEHFQKTIILIADVFSNLRTPKNMVREMSKKSRFRESFSKVTC